MTDNSKVLALFPGQGSQKVGMGKAFFDSSERAREMFSQADEALGFSLSKLCFEGPANKLMETAHTQPAILTVSAICFELTKEALGNSLSIVAAAGHSLGEYSALVAAGALDLSDAVSLVHKRGTYMQEAVPTGKGKMVAVLGKEVAELETALEKTSGIASLANINSPGQIVVAGSVEGVDEFVEHLGDAKVKELEVSAPFHCELMQPAADKLAVDLDNTNFRRCEFPVYANAWAKAVSEPEEIRKALKDQVCGRVRWVECMQNAISESHPHKAIEFGEGNVLQGLLKRIEGSLGRTGVSAPESLAKLSS